jgi:hypothetical protein
VKNIQHFIPQSKRTPTPDSGTDKIQKLLLQAGGRWVPAPELSRISLAYTRCVFELRQEHGRGYVENRVVVVRGSRHGYYRIPLYAGEPAPALPERSTFSSKEPKVMGGVNALLPAAQPKLETMEDLRAFVRQGSDFAQRERGERR